MASRLERFKAAVKDDLDKIPDKPKPAELPTPPPEVSLEQENVAPTSTRVTDHSTARSNISDASKAEHGQPTPPEAEFERMTFIDSSHLDSDDSESGCPIAIEEVGDDDVSGDENIDTKVPEKKQPSFLGPKMKFAQVTIHGEAFCPISPVAKYPYKYVPKADSQAVASAFFDNGQFWAREWDLFYVWPLEPTDKPIIFIRESQFAQLLREVSAKFRTLNIDPREGFFRQIKLVTAFPDHPRLLPRYLARSKSKDDHDTMLRQVPKQSPFVFPHGEPEAERAPSDEQVADFEDICETAIDLGRAKQRSKDKSKEKRVGIQANLTKQLRRAQRYCGVLPPSGLAKGAPALDINVPPPYPFESDAVIICCDLEAYEYSHNIITEIGFATLDTRDLKDLAPGTYGENWRSKIRARHFRILEHMKFVNGDHCQSNPDRFEKEFGQTEFIDLKDACRAVASCFKEPFSRQPTQEEIDASWAKLAEEGGEKPSDVTTSRNIVFLGHNPASDVGFLKTLGYNPENLLNLIEFLDTAGLDKAHRRSRDNVRSVSTILGSFDLTGWNLHNAGNDAVYTMWIFLATIIAEAQKRGKEVVKEDESDEAGGRVNKMAVDGDGDGDGKGKTKPKPAISIDDFVVPEEYKVW